MYFLQTMRASEGEMDSRILTVPPFNVRSLRLAVSVATTMVFPLLETNEAGRSCTFL
jgi:hypothetical protein